MKILYGPKGRAGEYGELACNLKTTCTHGCLYCYCPSVLRKSREAFYTPGPPRLDALKKLEADCKELQEQGNTKPIFLSFLDDPCQVGQDNSITLEAVDIAHRYEQRVNILTKGGESAWEVKAALTPGKDIFGVTLTCFEDSDSRLWEPGAALPGRRVDVLYLARLRGVETRVSFEPVLSPRVVLMWLPYVRKYVDLIQVGKLNTHPGDLPEVREREAAIDWPKFAHDAYDLLEKLGGRYMLKQDLLRYL